MKERELPANTLMPPFAAVLLVAELMVMGKAAPAARWIGGFVKWLTEEVAIGSISFPSFTRLIAAAAAKQRARLGLSEA